MKIDLLNILHSLPGNLLLASPLILVVVKAALIRRRRNPQKPPLQNPSLAMTVVWRVFLLTVTVAAISGASIFIAVFATYNGMLPTAPDGFHAHAIQAMGHRAYLSDFLDRLRAGMWWAWVVSVCLVYPVLCLHSVLTEREKERRHDIRIAWMKSRPE
ncbi:MAG TPA: hypothetical protein VGG01_20485 [Xanthobacteraceae bacterium]|jgi:hypothetical protein